MNSNSEQYDRIVQELLEIYFEKMWPLSNVGL